MSRNLSRNCNQTINLTCFTLSEAARLTLINNCSPLTIWPATLGNWQLSETGFELRVGESRTIDIGAGWNGRVWARSHCSWNNGRFQCRTGDCGTGRVSCDGAGGVPPATLFQLSSGNDDFYSVSLVDGYNLGMQVTARGGSCTTIYCRTWNTCPEENLKVKDFSAEIGCKSACLAYGGDANCCTGSGACSPNWIAQKFKENCPNAYTYAQDHSANKWCNGHSDYEIKFCP